MADLPITGNPEFSETMEQITSQDRAAPGTFNSRYQILLDNDNYLKAEEERIKGTKIIQFPATDWSASAPYTQTVQVPEITEEDSPILSVYISDGTTYEEEKLQKKAFGFISYIDTGAGTITATCLGKKPVTNFQLIMKGV